MFSTIDKFIAGSLALIFVYLIINKSDGTTAVFNGLTSLTTKTFATLQGRNLT